MERNILVDRLKGYACFLVLFGHVIMGVRLSGVNMPSFFEGLEKFIWSFHVPLFMFLSGVVYKFTNEWKGKKTRHGFIIHKLLNLGIPYAVFSIVYILINSLVGGANNQASLSDILFIWKTPIAQYWFLYSLFVLFFIWTILSKIFKNWQITIIAFGIWYLAYFLKIPLGSFDAALYSALAFGIGTFIDFEKISKPSNLIKYLFVLLHIVAGIICAKFGIIEALGIKEIMLLLGIYASIMLISLLQKLKPFASFLEFMNKYSFQIYLLHTIFTAGIRIVMLRLNITNWAIHIIVGTVFGIGCSVLAAVIARKTKILDFFFFPTKVLKTR